MVDAGASVETVNAYDVNVGGCLGCFTCWTHTPGVCAVRDDMDKVIASVKQADILVLATPVYCDGMTGRLKVIVDRMIPIVHGATELRDGHMRHLRRASTNLHTIALVSACGFVERDNFDPLISHVQGFAKHMGCVYAGGLTLPGGLISSHVETIRQAAREAGTELARSGVIPPHLQEAVFGHSCTPADAVETLNRYFDNPPAWAAAEKQRP
jgi:hypothetical protein